MTSTTWYYFVISCICSCFAIVVVDGNPNLSGFILLNNVDFMISRFERQLTLHHQRSLQYLKMQ